MNIKELASLVVVAHPDELGKLPEQKVRLIIREALQQIKAAVELAQEGVVAVDQLGQFKVRHAEVERDGEKTSVRRVMFHAGKKQAKPEEGAAPAAAE
jgi:nucleoid DNA-binding protein